MPKIIVFTLLYTLLTVSFAGKTALANDGSYASKTGDALRAIAGDPLHLGETFNIIYYGCAGASLVYTKEKNAQLCINEGASFVGKYRYLIDLGRTSELYSGLILDICSGVPGLTTTPHELYGCFAMSLLKAETPDLESIKGNCATRYLKLNDREKQDLMESKCDFEELVKFHQQTISK